MVRVLKRPLDHLLASSLITGYTLLVHLIVGAERTPLHYSACSGNLKCCQDNLFVTVVASIQYRPLTGKASDAFYRLSNTRTQVQVYVYDVILASVPNLILDDVFERMILQEQLKTSLKRLMLASARSSIQPTLRSFSTKFYKTWAQWEEFKKEAMWQVCHRFESPKKEMEKSKKTNAILYETLSIVCVKICIPPPVIDIDDSSTPMTSCGSQIEQDNMEVVP